MLFFAFISVKAQNLVPNNGLDTYTSCPTLYAQLPLASPWNNVAGHGGTADYYNSCFVVTAQSGVGWNVPVNAMGSQMPYSGNGYAGLFTYSNTAGSREYITVPLISPLVAGKKYYVGFHVNLADEARKATDGFGAYLSVGPVTSTTTFANLPYVPQVSNPSGNMLNDKVNWTLISGYVIAQGGENYLTIGNFNNNANTITQSVGETGINIAYYFVDEAFVIPAFTVKGNDICLGDSVTLEAFGDVQYAWADSLAPNVILSTDSTFTVSPSLTTTYMVYGSTDTISYTVHVNSTNLPPVFNLGNDTTLCQGETLLLDASSFVDSYSWQDSSTDSTYTVVQPGIYWATTMLENCITSDTIVVAYSPLPLVELGSDTSLCYGDSIVLDVSIPNATYLWQDGSTDSSYSVTQQGIYFVTVTSNNCSATDSIIVNYYPAITTHLGNDTSFCPGDSLLLDATETNVSYLWQDGSTMSTYTATQADTFWVVVSTNYCSIIDSIVIDHYPIPQIDLGNDTTLCPSAVLVLDASSNNSTYLWQDNSINPTFTLSQPGEYFVEVTTQYGCVNWDAIQIGYTLPLSVDLGPDLSLCDTQTVSLDATAPNSTYLWQNGTILPQFVVTQSGQYFVDVSNQCETKSDTVNVSYFNPPNHYLGNDTTLCEGTILVLQVNIPSVQVQWQDQSNSNTYTVSQPGTFTALITTAEGCQASDQITIDYVAFPMLDLGSDLRICEGEQQMLYNLLPSDGSYIWSTGSSDPQIFVDTVGYYSVLLFNQCGIASDSILVDQKGCNCEVYIPNAFTPDNDEHNAVFGAKYDCTFDAFNMKIYNRWGEQIWESNDPDIHWDGTYQNQKVQDGIYLYKVKYSSEFVENEMLLGHFVIVR